MSGYLMRPGAMNKERFDRQMNTGQYIIWAGNRIKDLEKDCKYLLAFAPFGYVPDGLSPMFYKTGTYEGDTEMAERVKEIQLRLKEGMTHES